MSSLAAFIFGFVLGFSIIAVTFYLMYSGGSDDVSEEDEFERDSEFYKEEDDI